MKEFKYIVHALLLLSAIAVVFNCLKIISVASRSEPAPILTRIDDLSAIPETSLQGKQLFIAKCAACHMLGRNFTGPSLCGFEDRGSWADRTNVYKWIKDPRGFMKKNEYAAELKKTYSTMMMAFPDITNEEIDDIIKYINAACTMWNGAIAKAD